MSPVFLRPPDAEVLERLRREQRKVPFSYRPGILHGPPPADMTRDELVFPLGVGDAAWARARAAILAWAPFAIEWAGITSGGEPPRTGLDVLVCARRYGLHFIAPCRVIESHDIREGGIESFGFTYGTLPGHVVSGEERFEVTRESATGRVRYQIRVMAAPGIWFARLGRPVVDRHRRQFREESATAMLRFVAGRE